MTLRVNIWSSPRNLSTALMYSWRQRDDTTVVDEPLYAHYLATTGRVHPGREAVLEAQDIDGERVVAEVMGGHYDTDIVVFKQMAKHLVGLDRSFMEGYANVLLTREPADMLASFARGVSDTNLDDTGLVELVEILEWVEASGTEPIVVESNQLLVDPPGVLAQLCDRLGVAFDSAMLSWPPGPKPEDGVWGEHWYQGVWESTGWGPPRGEPAHLDDRLGRILDEAIPLYQRLAHYQLVAGTE